MTKVTPDEDPMGVAHAAGLPAQSDALTHRCPKCQSADLEVTVEVWATLTQTADGFETDTTTPDDGSHNWDDISPMRCRACGHRAKAGAFEVTSPEPEGDDLCDTCMRSGIAVDHTHGGNTVCSECAKQCAECGNGMEEDS